MKALDETSGWNAYQLKLLAITAMLLDHVGAVFLPGVFWLRAFGRLTVPIMAFFVTEGFAKTRNAGKYALRLFLFALVSMVPYHLIFRDSCFNILFDLLFGLLVIAWSDRLELEWQKWTVAAAFSVLAIFLNTDGSMGVTLLVFLFHRFRNDFSKMALAAGILYIGVFALSFGYAVISGDQVMLHSNSLYVRPLSLFALFFIRGYNGEKGRGMKYFFYLFYPAHLMLLYIISLMIR